MCMAHEFKWGLPQFGNARFRPDWCGLGSSASLDSGMPATSRESSRLFSEKLKKVWENCCQSCSIMLYHVVSCSIMLYHVISCSIMLYHVVSCYIMFYHVISCSIMLYHVVSCYIMFYHVISCSIMLYHVLSCYIMLYHVISMLYHVI